MTISCLWATGFLFSGRGKHHIPIPIFQNKFGGIPSHVQSIGFNVCHSVDGRVDLLTGCNKSGADHFTMKHLSICWWLRQRINKPVAESFSLTTTLSFLLYSSSSELNHYHSILCPLSISELFMGDDCEVGVDNANNSYLFIFIVIKIQKKPIVVLSRVGFERLN